LYGVLGVLLAVPISSVIYTLLKRDVANQLKVDKEVDKRKYQ
ncbi:MAG: AI-2E family transporter, partial [Clostridium sp.]|nr:AI-2E family transporter [Clostridium sp.]